MKKIIVDSSVMVKWLNSQDESNLKEADKLLSDVEKGKIELFAPELAKYEVGNAMVYKSLDLPLAKASLSTLYLLPINFINLSEEEALEVLEMALIEKITYYDASFIVLAKKLKGILVTDNIKHQKIKGLPVVWLGDYK